MLRVLLGDLYLGNLVGIMGKLDVLYLVAHLWCSVATHSCIQTCITCHMASAALPVVFVILDGF